MIGIAVFDGIWRPHWAALIVAGVALAACSMEPRVASSTTDVVTVKYFGDEYDAAERQAREECDRYAKRAKLRTVSSGSSGERMAIFDCVV